MAASCIFGNPHFIIYVFPKCPDPENIYGLKDISLVTLMGDNMETQRSAGPDC